MPLSPVPSVASSDVAPDGTPRAILRWPGRAPFMGLLVVHTFGSHAARYQRVAGEIALGGITVEAFDLPGHGAAAAAGPPPAWTSMLDAVEDRLAALRADLPGLPVAIYGHGLGGLLAIDYRLSGREPRPDALILIAPTLAFRRPIPGWRLALAGRFGNRRIRLIEDPATLASDPALVADWQADPLVRWDYPVELAAEIQAIQGSVGTSLDRLPVPYLVLHGGQDPLAPANAWLAFPRPAPGTIDPDRPASMLPAMRHDLPVDQGWKERAGWHRSFLLGIGQRHFPATTPPPRGRTDWDAMPRAEAVRRFEAFVAGEADRLRRFDEVVARLGGPALDCSTESMDRFGAWMLEVIGWGEPPSDPPDWAMPTAAGHQLSADSIALIDGLATRIAACYRERVPGLEWRLCTTKIDAYYQRPVLEPLHLCHPIPATKVQSVLRDDVPDVHWLGKIFGIWEQNADRVAAMPLDVEDDFLPLDEIAVDEYDHPRFNAQIWIPEGAEVTLGEARFATLVDRLRKLKGITDIVHEDREIFLVRVEPGIDHDGLRRRVVAVVRRMKDAAAQDASPDEEPGEAS